MMLSAVDFPAPLGPIRPVIRPGGTVKDAPFTRGQLTVRNEVSEYVGDHVALADVGTLWPQHWRPHRGGGIVAGFAWVMRGGAYSIARLGHDSRPKVGCVAELRSRAACPGGDCAAGESVPDWPRKTSRMSGRPRISLAAPAISTRPAT